MTTFNTSGAISGELSTRLRNILLITSCETNIGRDLMLGSRKIPGDDRPPCMILIEGNDDPVDAPGRIPQVLISQNYMIDAFDVCDPDNPNTKALAMIRDIKRAIFKGDATLGGTVKKVSYLGRDIGPRPDGVAMVQARVMIAIEYVEDLTNP